MTDPVALLTGEAGRLAAFCATSRTLCLALLDGAGVIRHLSPGMERLLGLASDEGKGQLWWERCAEADRESLRLRIGAAPTGDEAPFLLNVVDVDRMPHTLVVTLLPLADGSILLGERPEEADQGIGREMIELNNRLAVLSRENARKGRELARALDELKRAQSLLVHREKMASLGQMTAGIAHEINNPIAFVLGNEHNLSRDMADLLAFVTAVQAIIPRIDDASPIRADLEGALLQSEVATLLETVPRKIAANIEGLERVKELVLDLRTFSRLDEAERKMADVASGIRSSIRFLSPLIKERAVTVETEFAPLPPLLCAPGMLNQAVSNVVVNAIQASPPGGTVRVIVRPDGEDCLIRVEDRGPGIPPGDLPRVFDPFFTTKPVGSGTGLGLSIAHQVVAAHGGTIGITSGPGEGTRVDLRIPLRATNGEGGG